MKKKNVCEDCVHIEYDEDDGYCQCAMNLTPMECEREYRGNKKKK